MFLGESESRITSFLDIMANSVDPDTTVYDRDFSVMVKSHCSNFRTITTIFGVSEFSDLYMYVIVQKIDF